VFEGGQLRTQIQLNKWGDCIGVVDEDTLIVGEDWGYIELISINQAKVIHTYKGPYSCNCIERVHNGFIAGYGRGDVEVLQVHNSQIKKVLSNKICESDIYSIAVMDDNQVVCQSYKAGLIILDDLKSLSKPTLMYEG
jgi:hypothetical protein